MTPKALLPDRKITILNIPYQCPYRSSISIGGKNMNVCRYSQEEGYLRICGDYATFPDTCPLEDWEDVKKRIQQQKEKEKEESK